MSIEDVVDYLDDHSVGIVNVIGVLIVIGYVVYCGYGIWEEENTAETIILHDGSQSYACEVSRGDQTPHECNPIKDAK